MKIIGYVYENALLSAEALIALEIGSNMFLKYRALEAPVEAFTHGVVPGINNTKLIPRPAELEALSHLIQVVAPNSNKYVIVVGEVCIFNSNFHLFIIHLFSSY